MTIYSRVVSVQEQEFFAELSGDRNPMHMDPVAARRTQAGAPVVHGIHTLLWALDTAVATGLIAAAPTRIKASFLKWIYLGDLAEMRVASTGEPSRIQVEVGGMIVLTADIFAIPQPSTPASVELKDSPSAPLPSALDLSFEQLEGRSGDAYVGIADDFKVAFPSLSASIGESAVAEIAACSYIVGMEAPGLHSMFSRADLTLSPETLVEVPRTALSFQVSYLDERFRKGRIKVAGRRIFGTLEVFVRVPPVRQVTIEIIAPHVLRSEFDGMRALVIGGSRGLGELTSKLIAAGGGVPTITYAVGSADAKETASNIAQWGATADTMAYDVRQPAAAQLEKLPALPTHLFYFATNTIYRPKQGVLSPAMLAESTQFYLTGFYNLCQELLRLRAHAGVADSKLMVFYPSTVFLDERPAGMAEYAMTKAAGEQLCYDMNRDLPDIEIISHRLPKLPTDQTAGVLPERSLDALEAMLPIIRRMRDRLLTE